MENEQQVKSITFSMTCSACPKKLSGGLDTFGSIRTPLCFDCFLGGDYEEKEADSLIHKVEEYKSLEDRYDEVIWGIDDLNRELKDLERKMRDIERLMEKKGSDIDELKKSVASRRAKIDAMPIGREQLRNFWVVSNV